MDSLEKKHKVALSVLGLLPIDDDSEASVVQLSIPAFIGIACKQYEAVSMVKTNNTILIDQLSSSQK